MSEKFDPVEALGASPKAEIVPAFDEQGVRVINWQCPPDPKPGQTTRMDISVQTFNYDPDWDK